MRSTLLLAALLVSLSANAQFMIVDHFQSSDTSYAVENDNWVYAFSNAYEHYDCDRDIVLHTDADDSQNDYVQTTHYHATTCHIDSVITVGTFNSSSFYYSYSMDTVTRTRPGHGYNREYEAPGVHFYESCNLNASTGAPESCYRFVSTEVNGVRTELATWLDTASGVYEPTDKYVSYGDSLREAYGYNGSAFEHSYSSFYESDTTGDVVTTDIHFMSALDSVTVPSQRMVTTVNQEPFPDSLILYSWLSNTMTWELLTATYYNGVTDSTIDETYYYDYHFGSIAGKVKYVYPDAPIDTVDSTIGISVVQPVVDLQLYPNPATEEVVVDANLPVQEVQLIDQRGVLLKTEVVSSNQARLSLHDVPSGIYHVRAVIGRRSVVRPVVVK